jgi:hypothetical protein
VSVPHEALVHVERVDYCTHVARSTDVSFEFRPDLEDCRDEFQAKTGGVAPEEPTPPAKLLKAKDRHLAERVGFVPVVPAPINDLRLIRNAQNAKSSQNLSIRYKTGTAQCGRADCARGTGYGQAVNHSGTPTPPALTRPAAEKRPGTM